MGGFAKILGGALSGVGKAIAAKGAAKMEQRHQQEMEALKQRNSVELVNVNAQNDMNRQERQYDLMERNDSASDGRQYRMQRDLQVNQQQFARETGAASAAAQATEADKDRAFRANQAALDRRARLEEAFGKPVNSYTDETTGDVTEIYRKPGGGQEVVTYKGIAKKQPKESTSTGSSLLTRGAGTKPGDSVAVGNW